MFNFEKEPDVILLAGLTDGGAKPDQSRNAADTYLVESRGEHSADTLCFVLI